MSCKNWDQTLERAKCHFQAWGSAEAVFGQVALALYPEDGVERVLWVQTQLVSGAAARLCESCTMQLWGRLACWSHHPVLP